MNKFVNMKRLFMKLIILFILITTTFLFIVNKIENRKQIQTWTMPPMTPKPPLALPLLPPTPPMPLLSNIPKYSGYSPRYRCKTYHNDADSITVCD